MNPLLKDTHFLNMTLETHWENCWCYSLNTCEGRKLHKAGVNVINTWWRRKVEMCVTIKWLPLRTQVETTCTYVVNPGSSLKIQRNARKETLNSFVCCQRKRQRLLFQKGFFMRINAERLVPIFRDNSKFNILFCLSIKSRWRKMYKLFFDLFSGK